MNSPDLQGPRQDLAANRPPRLPELDDAGVWGGEMAHRNDIEPEVLPVASRQDVETGSPWLRQPRQYYQ